MMLVIRIAPWLLEKARKGAHLVPEKRMVTRDGTTFQTTVWVDPRDKKALPQGGFDFDEAHHGGKVRKYYVTMAREGRKDHAWLAGPYDTHEEALSRVDEAREHAHRVDPRSAFDAFGTASYEAGEGKHIQGKLNDLMKQKEGKEVGPSGAMYLSVDGSKNLAPVASLKEASEKFAKVRDEAERQGGGGASKTPRVEVVDANGTVVGVVSYNGRVWAPKDYGKTDAGIKPIYDNRKPKMVVKVQ